MAPADEELFAALKKLRLEIAQQREVPAFVVFGDKSLVDMAGKKPADVNEFGEIFGVGEAKLKDFAAPFLAEIANFSTESFTKPR
ncbi:MAG: HRDC domain-containing protein [Alphaproteobacteria bacterium]